MSADTQDVWCLLSREDHTKNGDQRIDPIPGADPIGMLFHTKNHFAAQFTKRDRTGGHGTLTTHTVKNNTVAINGYDAYFGNYEADEKTGKVLHTLTGSVNPSNIGLTVSRYMRVNEKKLIIQRYISAAVGETIFRMFTWKRIS